MGMFRKKDIVLRALSLSVQFRPRFVSKMHFRDTFYKSVLDNWMEHISFWPVPT